MTIATSTARADYAGDGVSTVFTVPFYFLDNTHLEVVKRDAAGAETVLVKDVHYTVVGASVPAGGSVTMLTAPAAGEQLTIRRAVPATQTLDYVANDPFPADSHERGLDKLTMIVQQQAEELSRSVRARLTDGPLAALPKLMDRQGRVLGFDPTTGQPVAGALLSNLDAAVAAVLAGTSIGQIPSVSAIATMAALPKSSLTDGEVLFVHGYHTPGDTGGGHFVWDAVSTATIDDGLVFASGEGGAGRWRRIVADGVISLGFFGPAGDNAVDDGARIAKWMAAIPEDGEGFIPAAPTAYKCSAALVRATRCTIRGVGIRSRIHYSGAGIALSFEEARFSRFENFYISGTSAAAGGVWFKMGQEGLFINQFYVDGFTGASAYAWRFSDCWTFVAMGGAARQSTIGILLDDTDLGAGGINNSFTLFCVNCSETGVGVAYQSGNAGNILGCDFTNAGAIVAPVAAIEIGCDISGDTFIGAVLVQGCWTEGDGDGVVVGRNNTSSATPKNVTVGPNYFGHSGDQVRLYKADLSEIRGNQWGPGSLIIEAGVTRTTVVASGATVTDGSTAGQTSYFNYDGVAANNGTFRSVRAGPGPFVGGDSAALEVTGGAFIFPPMTSTERDALTPAPGMAIYNETNLRVEIYSSGAWGAL